MGTSQKLPNLAIKVPAGRVRSDEKEGKPPSNHSVWQPNTSCRESQEWVNQHRFPEEGTCCGAVLLPRSTAPEFAGLSSWLLLLLSAPTFLDQNPQQGSILPLRQFFLFPSTTTQ